MNIEGLYNSSLLLKGVNEPIEHKTKEQRVGFLRMLLGTLGASSLRNMLAGKDRIRIL